MSHRFVLCASILTLLATTPVAAVPQHVSTAEIVQAGGSGGQVTAVISIGSSEGGLAPGDYPAGAADASFQPIVLYWSGPHGRCTAPGIQDAGLYRLHQRDLRTGSDVVVAYSCSPPESAPQVSQPPPPPPSPQAVTALVRDQAGIVVPDVRVSPPGRGVTGFESWFWYDGQDGVRVSATLGGWAVEATMAPTRWCWLPEAAGQDWRCAETPGNADAPAARHVYETSRPNTVRIQVTWAGSYRVSRAGVGSGGGTLDPIVVRGSTDYPITQIRSVLIG